MVICPRVIVFVVCPNGSNVHVVLVLWHCDFWCVVWYVGGWVGRSVVGFLGGWEGFGSGFKCTNVLVNSGEVGCASVLQKVSNGNI